MKHILRMEYHVLDVCCRKRKHLLSSTCYHLLSEVLSRLLSELTTCPLPPDTHPMHSSPKRLLYITHPFLLLPCKNLSRDFHYSYKTICHPTLSLHLPVKLASYTLSLLNWHTHLKLEFAILYNL